jgi:hypothetical protein
MHRLSTILHVAGVAPILQVHMSAILSLPVIGNYWSGSNGITFIPNFMKIGQLVKKLKGGTHPQTACWSHKATFLPKKREGSD